MRVLQRTRRTLTRLMAPATVVIQAVRGVHDRGMTTAEYAVGTVAACGFAALLFKIVTSDQIRGMVTDIVERALELPF